jgi:aspartate aminotransferase
MPQISTRGTNMPPSAIRKLVPYAEQAISRGTHVHHLNIGQPDLPPSDTTLSAIRSTRLNVVIGYSHSAGNETYRKKLAEYYKKLDIKITADDILITTGGSEAIMFTFMSCLNAGDEIIMPEPFYSNYNSFATATGVKIIPITSYIEHDFALPPVAEFEKRITPKTKGIFICNPNNPTGYLYSKDEIEKLGDLARKHDLYLFADEVYRGLCYEDHPFFSVMHLEEMDDHIVLIDSASKRYNACGLRVGAMISRNRDIINTALKFAQARLSPPHFGQIAGEAALDSSQEYLNKIFEEFKSRRDFIVKELNNMDGVYTPNPRGAFYVLVRLPVDNSEKFAQWLLSDFSHQGQTVMVAPASGFYATEGLGLNEVRLAYVLKEHNLKKAMECLDIALKEYPGRVNPKVERSVESSQL